MEHRAGFRYPASIPAKAEHRRLGPVNGRIRDVSMSGLYLEMPAVQLHGVSPITLWFTPVRLRFRLPGGESEPVREWRGYVTRVEKGGLAATNAGSDAGDSTDLIALLEHARRRSRANDLAAA